MFLIDESNYGNSNEVRKLLFELFKRIICKLLFGYYVYYSDTCIVMPRRTKEQLKKDRNEKRIYDMIQNVKWLREPKFYPTNYWSWAHWESWARQGKDGSCGCGAGYYSASLCNTRRRTRKGGHTEYCRHVVEKLCDDCVKQIEAKIGVEFKRSYAP